MKESITRVGGAEEVEGVADDVRKVFTEEGRVVLQVCVTHWNGGLAVSSFSIVDFRAPWGCAQSLMVTEWLASVKYCKVFIGLLHFHEIGIE